MNPVIPALIADLILGDPKSTLHPVAMIGYTADLIEKFADSIMLRGKISGIFSSLICIAGTAVTAASFYQFFLIYAPEYVFYLSAVLISFSFSVRSLFLHVYDVYSALKKKDMNLARLRTGMIVGRNTMKLSKGELIRASVESTSESLTDSIIAPLFYSTLGYIFFELQGAVVFAYTYRAANTLDSMWGHKNKKYSEFGYFPAKLDDALNFVPARVSAFLIILSSGIIRADMKNSFRIWIRDRKKHPSPNGGQTESAAAGALGIRLGGWNQYGERTEFRHYMGDALKEKSLLHIKQILILTGVSTSVFTVCLYASEALIRFFSH